MAVKIMRNVANLLFNDDFALRCQLVQFSLQLIQSSERVIETLNKL